MNMYVDDISDIANEFCFIPVQCIKGGMGFFEGYYYALIRGAYNNGWSVMRNTMSGDVYELIVHNTSMTTSSGQCIDVLADMETFSVIFVESSKCFFELGYDIPKQWGNKLQEYENSLK